MLGVHPKPEALNPTWSTYAAHGPMSLQWLFRFSRSNVLAFACARLRPDVFEANELALGIWGLGFRV